MPQKRIPLFDTTEDQTLRIQKELAVKIGFNEAIVLMQIEYLISISTSDPIDGKWWTYQTLEELKENSFPWWSIATISRTLRSLKDQGVIFIDRFNKRGGDKTQWFALNIEKCKELGIKLNDKHPILQNEKWVESEEPEPIETPQIEPESEPELDPILQNDSTIFHFETPILQNETTLPETPSETPLEISPNGDSGKKPQEDSKKWDNANKQIVADKFFELTRLPDPGKKVIGFWYGWLFDIFRLSNKDPAETCRIMGLVVDYMQKKHLTISSPKSLHWGVMAIVSGQELNGVQQNGTPRKYVGAAPDHRPEPTAGEIELANEIKAAFRARARTGGDSPQPEMRPLRPLPDPDSST